MHDQDRQGKVVEKNPPGFVYVFKDGPLTKIGYTRNVNQRLASNTDRPTPLIFVAAWSFASVQEAKAHRPPLTRCSSPIKAAAAQNGFETEADEVIAAAEDGMG